MAKKKEKDTDTNLSKAQYILQTNLEHDGKRYESGTVIKKWFGTDEQLQELLAAGSLKKYVAPVETESG